MLSTKFRFIWPSGFREDFYKSAKAKKKICVFPIAWSSKLGSVACRSGFFFFFFFYKPPSMLLPLKSYKLVCFFLTTAY